MGSLGSAVLEQYLKIGSAVSIEGSSREEIAATVQSFATDQIWLTIPRPGQSLPVGTGDCVQLKYWDEGSTIYGWSAKIVEVGPEDRSVALSIEDQDLNIQRRKAYRVRAQIPLSITIIASKEEKLTGQRLAQLTTENLTIGGLLFRTDLPLAVGDKLELQLDGGSLGKISALGWVIRTEPGKETDPEHSVAVQFLQLEDSDQHQLSEFLKSYY